MVSDQAAEASRVIQRYRAGLAGEGAVVTLEDRRAATDAMGQWGAPRDDVHWTRTDLGGVPGRRYTPATLVGEGVALHLHGGGYVMGSSTSHHRMMQHLAHHLSTVVVGPDYRLAPEHPFPAALEDARSVYDALLAEGHRSSDILLTGDSAGGGIVLALLGSLRDDGAPMPLGGVLFSPWLDLELTGPSMAALEQHDPDGARASLEQLAGMYIGDSSAGDWRISPINMDLRGLPPLLVHVSTAETFLEDSLRVTDLALAEDVDIELRTWDGLPHIFQIFAGFLPEADESLRAANEWVAARRG